MTMMSAVKYERSCLDIIGYARRELAK